MNTSLIDIAYLIAASLFILGIKGLSKPRTAVRGNLLAAIGMLMAIVVTLLHHKVISYEMIALGFALGAIIGAVMAVRVQMTAMPQMVAMLNGFGGLASLGVAAASYYEVVPWGTGATEALSAVPFGAGPVATIAVIAVTLTTLIGAVTFTGSLVAFAKLQQILPGRPIGFHGMKVVTGLVFTAAVAALIALVLNPAHSQLYLVIVGLALVLGVMLVMPIGGADMPVVIALLNSYSGLAAASAGFIMNNTMLIVAGSLVGASGLILTRIMCNAMNRSLTNVLFGLMAEGGEIIDADEVYDGKVKSASSDEIAMLLETARRVVIVPGFGMAMSQAQHAVRELADTLQSRGVEVEYAIHPVAGRMPGHMNVLLAEAEVPYEQLVEMEKINPTFEQTDVTIVIGANDVTNPMAREDKDSPIYGMPILNVDKSKTVVVIKRSLSPGFAGLPNPLFAKDNTLMVFGDGKQAVLELTQSLNEAA